MRLSIETFIHNDIPVNYCFRNGSSDRRHLLVVLSGYRPKGTFDFSGSTVKDLKCDILWIEDWFEENHTYYIRTGSGFGPSFAIQELISKVLGERGLTKNECTLAGFSKGGSGSLYHGLRFDYPNIISAAPRVNIGSSTKIRHPDVFANMTSKDCEEEISGLDQLIPVLLKEDVNLARNIYLISSPMDYQYESEIQPFLHLFHKYENFNYIETNSLLVREHVDVTWYNIPIILATVMALSDGARPQYGTVRNGGDSFSRDHDRPSIEEVSRRGEVVSGFTGLRLDNGKLFPEGFAFVKGIPASEYRDIARFLVLRSAEHTYEYRLGGVHDHRMSSRFFENEYCNYSKVKFASLKFRGISLADIEDGSYDMGILLHHGEHAGTVLPGILQSTVREAVYGDKFLRISVVNGVVKFTKRPISSKHAGGGFFSLEKFWTKGTLFHAEGYFALVGFETRNWSDVGFYLLFQKRASGSIVSVLRLAKDSRSNISDLLDDSWGDYSKSYFATSMYAGVETADVPDGQYDLLVTANFSGNLFTRQLGLMADVSSVGIEVINS